MKLKISIKDVFSRLLYLFDQIQVDRSAAYAARWVAKSLVKAGLCRRCLVQVLYVHCTVYGLYPLPRAKILL